MKNPASGPKGPLAGRRGIEQCATCRVPWAVQHDDAADTFVRGFQVFSAERVAVTFTCRPSRESSQRYRHANIP